MHKYIFTSKLHPPQLEMGTIYGCFYCLCLWECSVCLCGQLCVCMWYMHVLCVCVPAGATSSVCCWLDPWHAAITASAATWSVGPSMMYFSITIAFFKKRIFRHIFHGVLFTILYPILSFRSCFLDLQSAFGIALI